MVTERGIACNECTLSQMNHPPGMESLLQKYQTVNWLESADTNIIKCDLCQVKMEKTANMFIMPNNIHLCSTHANKTTMRNIMNTLSLYPDLNKEEIVLKLNELDRQNFDNNPINSHRHLKAVNNFSKLKSRSKRR